MLGSWREMTQVETRPSEKSGQKRGRLVPALVVVAAALLVGALAILSQSDETSPAAPNPPDTTVVGVVESPEQAMAVATTYLEVWLAGDLATSSGLIAGDNMRGFFNTTNYKEIGAEVAWWDAAGWINDLGECRLFNPDPTATRVSCEVTTTTAVSRVTGVEPLVGEYMVTVRNIDGRTAVTDGELFRMEGTRFATEIWEPFENWIEANYPSDADTMYDNTFVVEFFTKPMLTAESIELWRQYTEEFVAEHSGG